MRSLVKELDKFVEKHQSLLESDGVALASLYIMAEQIDQDPAGNSKLFGNFGIAYRDLVKRAGAPKSKLGEFMSQ